MNLQKPEGTPVGEAVRAWAPPPAPRRRDVNGRLCAVEALTPREHADDLFDAFAADVDGRLWTYLPCGPFTEREAFHDWLEERAAEDEPLFYALRDLADGRVGGLAAYRRVAPAQGSLELGPVVLAPRMQRGRAATEGLHLMIAAVFDLGWRRLVWRADALDARGRASARRLGFAAEGVARQSSVVKGRNRDAAVHALLDVDWPAVAGAHRRWLDPANFDADGRQRRALSSLVEAALDRGAAP